MSVSTINAVKYKCNCYPSLQRDWCCLSWSDQVSSKMFSSYNVVTGKLYLTHRLLVSVIFLFLLLLLCVRHDVNSLWVYDYQTLLGFCLTTESVDQFQLPLLVRLPANLHRLPLTPCPRKWSRRGERRCGQLVRLRACFSWLPQCVPLEVRLPHFLNLSRSFLDPVEYCLVPVVPSDRACFPRPLYSPHLYWHDATLRNLCYLARKVPRSSLSPTAPGSLSSLAW